MRHSRGSHLLERACAQAAGPLVLTPRQVFPFLDSPQPYTALMRLYKLSLSVVLSLVASTAIGAVDSSRKGFARERRLHGHAHLAARSQHLSGAYSGAGATQKMSASSYTVPAATSSSSMSASPVATNSISDAASYTSPASDGSAYATPSLHMASATTTSGLAPVPSVSSTPPSANNTDLVVLQLAVVLEVSRAFRRLSIAMTTHTDQLAVLAVRPAGV